MRSFKLPPAIVGLLEARNQVRSYYRKILHQRGCDAELHFTLDGNLIGDIGEAISVELFGICLVERKSTEGIDGYAPDGRTVQVKATGKGYGPAFRPTETRADHLLFFDLDFNRASGIVVFNGPEHLATSMLPPVFKNQRSLTAGQIRNADRLVAEEDRLKVLQPSAT